jgi:hypothetical protein
MGAIKIKRFLAKETAFVILFLFLFNFSYGQNEGIIFDQKVFEHIVQAIKPDENFICCDSILDVRYKSKFKYVFDIQFEYSVEYFDKIAVKDIYEDVFYHLVEENHVDGLLKKYNKKYKNKYYPNICNMLVKQISTLQYGSENIELFAKIYVYISFYEIKQDLLMRP